LPQKTKQCFYSHAASWNDIDPLQVNAYYSRTANAISMYTTALDTVCHITFSVLYGCETFPLIHSIEHK